MIIRKKSKGQEERDSENLIFSVFVYFKVIFNLIIIII